MSEVAKVEGITNIRPAGGGKPCSYATTIPMELLKLHKVNYKKHGVKWVWVKSKDLIYIEFVKKPRR